MVRKNAMDRFAGICHAARRVKVSAIAAALSSPEPSPRTAVASLPREISARPAAQRAVALKDKHKFKTDMDAEAIAAMFPHMHQKVA